MMFFVMVLVFLGFDGTSFAIGEMVTDKLRIGAVIHTEEADQIDAVWQKGDEGVTAAGDHVIWGYFYADPADVSWGMTAPLSSGF